MTKWNLVRGSELGPVITKVDCSFEDAMEVKNALEDEYGFKIVMYEAM